LQKWLRSERGVSRWGKCSIIFFGALGIAGALAVHGQLDPMHLEDLRERCCFFYRRGSCLLVHSRDSELQQYIVSGNAALTRLDGEWCMGFLLNDN
jgi:hypothetical protein